MHASQRSLHDLLPMPLISFQCLGSSPNLIALEANDSLAVVDVRLQRIMGLMLGERLGQ